MERMQFSWKHILAGLAVVILAIAADQLSKWYLLKTLPEIGKNQVTVIENFFYISHVRNTGAAWGIFSSNTMILVWITGLVILLMFLFLFFTNRMMLTIPVAMIVGGGLGNMYDRIFRDGVIDFLDVYFWEYDYPVFNVADSILVVGVILLLVYVFFLYKEENPGFRSLRVWKK